jgi:flagellar basal-body rod protein FlgB
MYQDLNMFQIAGAMAQHAGTRQAIVAANVANADTPGYQSMQMASFRDVYTDTKVGEMRATRPMHMGGVDGRINATPMLSTAEPAPNGNTVSVEDEMLAAVAVGREHNRALAIYRHGMTVLRATMGRN